MASDLTEILKKELSNTLEQLLSKKSTIASIDSFDSSKYENEEFIKIDINFDFQSNKHKLIYLIPTKSATNYEFLMLGGMGDLKTSLDDETLDAVNEIVSNICGSFCTSVNAQGFPDASSIKFDLEKSSIEKNAQNIFENSLEFNVNLDDESFPIILSFSDIIAPYFSSITKIENTTSSEAPPVLSSKPTASSTAVQNNTTPLPKNMELLQSVKLKLSVRLGTKVVLLKDILKWDIGEIIELEQMVNEPLEVLVNGVKIGEGEAVIVEGKFGLRIKRLGIDEAKMAQIGL